MDLTCILDPAPCTATLALFGLGTLDDRRSGAPTGAVTLVKITAATAASLDTLTATLDNPGTGIAHSLHRLTLVASAAIPSYLGLSIVVSHGNSPLTITTLADAVAPVGQSSRLYDDQERTRGTPSRIGKSPATVAGDIRTSLHLSLPGPGGLSDLVGGGDHSVRRVTGNLCRPRRGPGLAYCRFTKRIRPR